MERRTFVRCLAAAGLTSVSARRALGADTVLRIALGGAVTTIDPHFYSAVPNNTVAMHMFERLVHRAPTGALVPGLALSWAAVGPTIWEFKLRPGVKFHDGGDFTADDVAFSFGRAPNVPNSPGGYGVFLRAVQRVEVVDPLTVRLHTDGPAADLLVNLLTIGIVSRRLGQDATTADYNSGKAAVGTGPYRFAAYTPGDRIELARFDSWWGPRQPWQTVTMRLIANPAARTAAILTGDVDLIDTPSISDLPRLRTAPALQVASVPGTRMMYFVPDVFRPDGGPFVKDSKGAAMTRNPFQDHRVREALSLAVNRPALAERVMLDTATPTGQWIPPGMYSHAPAVKPPQFDLARAKQLMAEAGYAEGFRLTVHAPNDRYLNDAQQAQAVAQMWTRLGLQVTVETLPWAVFAAQGTKREYSMSMWGWGSQTLEGAYALASCFATTNRDRSLGLNNYGGYGNPEVDALVEAAAKQVDQAKREALLIAATEKVSADIPVIPTIILQNLWAVRKGITFQPRPDEYTLAMDAAPA